MSFIYKLELYPPRWTCYQKWISRSRLSKGALKTDVTRNIPMWLCWW